jgi:enoyl-[acyl-carrier protein] reductase I
MSNELPPAPLKGLKALVVGVANQHSIAYGCAKAFRELGAELAITYVNEKTRTYVEPLAKELEATIFMPLDVGTPGMLEAVFEESPRVGQARCGPTPIAFAPKISEGRSSCSAEGFKGGDGRLLPLVRTHGAAAP